MAVSLGHRLISLFFSDVITTRRPDKSQELSESAHGRGAGRDGRG